MQKPNVLTTSPVISHAPQDPTAMVDHLRQLLAYVVQLEIGNEAVPMLVHIKALAPDRYEEIRREVLGRLSPKVMMASEPDELLVAAASHGKLHTLGARLLLKWYSAAERQRQLRLGSR